MHGVFDSFVCFQWPFYFLLGFLFVCLFVYFLCLCAMNGNKLINK